MVVVSAVAVAEAIGLAIVLTILATRGPSPTPVVAAGDGPRPIAPALAGGSTPVVAPTKAGSKAAEVPRGKRGQRVESAGFGITVVKIDYEPTYKGVADVGAGQRYLALLILAENNTGENAGFFPALFHLQDDQGFEYKPLPLRLKTPTLEWRTMGNRETIRGYVDFGVPKSAKGLKLIYSHLPSQGSQPIHVDLAE